MILFLYNLFTRSYPLALRIAGLWNNKANLWINGRKKFPVTAKENENEIIWMHCASLGEFEQGRPLLEVIKNKYPACKIVITFFSPSGYEIQKNYSGADHVFYLPIDSSANAKKFIELINPTLVLWIKYEFWYYYLKELKNKNIATLLISAAFRSEQIFFKWYGSFWRQMLGFFTHLFVQNDHTKSLLEKTDLKNITVSGDTRFDRVIAIAENFKEIDLIKDFLRRQQSDYWRKYMGR